MRIINLLLKALRTLGIRVHTRYNFKGTDGIVYAFEESPKVEAKKRKSVDLSAEGIDFTARIDFDGEDVAKTTVKQIINFCEEIRLTKILVRVKKPRIKKKLAKRIAKLKCY